MSLGSVLGTLRRDEKPVPGRSGIASHAATLLPGLVHRRVGRRVEGWCQGAQKPSQQGEAQPGPRTKHGPPVPMTDVLWYSVDESWITRQLKIDASHTGAQRDDAACSSHEKKKPGYILHEIMLSPAAQHSDDPAKEDDGHGHAYEAGRHPLQVECVPLILSYGIGLIHRQVSGNCRR